MLIKSLADDARLEGKSITNFNSMIKEMNTVNHNLHKAIRQSRAEFGRLTGLLASLNATLVQKKTIRANTIQNLGHTICEQKAYNKNYALETKERTREVHTIERVIEIIKKHTHAINRSHKLS